MSLSPAQEPRDQVPVARSTPASGPGRARTKVGVIGLGFVGGAIRSTFSANGHTVKGYDLYKESDSLEATLDCNILFLCLPTVYMSEKKEYDKGPLTSTCRALAERGYTGVVLIKSTVEPGTTNELSAMFPSLKLVHNPEFLNAATALEDFKNQKHVVLGKSESLRDRDLDDAVEFYSTHFPEAAISICTSGESESTKIFANSFYAVKIQFFNEMFAMCKSIGTDYNRVRDLIVKNGWVNPMHTQVPGPDGQLSYGGLCFPKDTTALMQQMKRAGLPCKVLESTIEERNEMRGDKHNYE